MGYGLVQGLGCASLCGIGDAVKARVYVVLLYFGCCLYFVKLCLCLGENDGLFWDCMI